MPNQTGRKRTKEQLARDRTEEARLWCQGRTLRQIAEEITASRPYRIGYTQVRNDMEAVLKEWRSERMDLMQDHVTAELARINHMEATAWAEWDRSRLDRQRKITKRTTGDAGAKDEAGITTEGRLGDPRYLATVQWCIERRCRMLGLDAPEKHEHAVVFRDPEHEGI